MSSQTTVVRPHGPEAAARAVAIVALLAIVEWLHYLPGTDAMLASALRDLVAWLTQLGIKGAALGVAVASVGVLISLLVLGLGWSVGYLLLKPFWPRAALARMAAFMLAWRAGGLATFPPISEVTSDPAARAGDATGSIVWVVLLACVVIYLFASGPERKPRRQEEPRQPFIEES